MMVYIDLAITRLWVQILGDPN